jgi:hemerythrin
MSRYASDHSTGLASSLDLGDSDLDHDHEKFRELATRLLSAAPSAVAMRLAQLVEHARFHFAAEDLDLRGMQSGNASCHIDEHAAVLKSLLDVRDIVESDSVSEEDKAVLVQRLSHNLLLWLPEHVREMDAGVAAYRSQKRFGGAPVQLSRR